MKKDELLAALAKAGAPIESNVAALVEWAEQTRLLKDSVAQLKEMHARPGAMELRLKQQPGLAEWNAQCMAHLLLDAPNYVEAKFDVVAHKQDGAEWITVCIQKGNGKTPHELRKIAEDERDQLRAQLERENL